MCKTIDTELAVEAQGVFAKGNEPEPLVMRVMVAPCLCGRQKWASVKGGMVWVEGVLDIGQNVA